MNDHSHKSLPRDESFSRHSADVGLAYLVGRHVEIHFIQIGQEIIFEELEDSNAAYGAEVRRSLVASVRTTPGSATGLAMDILEEMVSYKSLAKDRTISKLKEIIEKLEGGSSSTEE